MKWLLALFSLYILVLTSIPCQGDDDRGSCSPFFACSDCHGFVVPETEVAVPAQQPTQPRPQAVYKGRPLPDFSSIIWQPPKMA